MSKTIKFIDTVVRHIKSTDKRQVFWCDGCPSFGLRVTPSNSKSFVFKYTVTEKGKRYSRWFTIGRYPEWSIRAARKKYDELYDLVHLHGRDPVAEKKIDEENQKTRLFVKDLVIEYLEHCSLKGKVSIYEEERTFNKDLLPSLGAHYINEVVSSDIDTIQKAILKRAKSRQNASRDGRVAIKNTLAYIRQLFNYAVKKSYIDKNPVLEIDSLGASGNRDRILNFEEIWRFWHGLEGAGIPPVTANALKFSLVTMQRGKEIRNMRWDALKLNEGVWQMEREDTKNKTMHRVPLNQYALDIIETVRPYTGACPYVFGATRAVKQPKIANPKLRQLGKTAFCQATKRSQNLIGIDDFRPHDLRRTGATWITAVGLPKLYAQLMLNHSDGDNDVTGEVYVQYSYDFEKRKAMNVWESVLEEIVGKPSVEDIPNLISLRDLIFEADIL